MFLAHIGVALLVPITFPSIIIILSLFVTFLKFWGNPRWRIQDGNHDVIAMSFDVVIFRCRPQKKHIGSTNYRPSLIVTADSRRQKKKKPGLDRLKRNGRKLNQSTVKSYGYFSYYFHFPVLLFTEICCCFFVLKVFYSLNCFCQNELSSLYFM